MDINQIASMIEWLDEERRRDKSLLAALEDRVLQQMDTMDTVQRRVNAVESDQVLLKQEAMPLSKEQDLLEQMRDEARRQLENAEARRLTAEREAERRYELQRSNFQRAINKISEKTERIERQISALGDLQAEGDRLTVAMRKLNQEIGDISKQLEGPDRRLSLLEDQRRSDARRLSDIETELPDYKKSLDGIQPKMLLLEELALRNERRLQDMGSVDQERREQIQQFIDQQQLLSQQRDQQLSELTRRFNVHDDELQQNLERFEVWAQAYREMRRIIDDFNRISDRLERRIGEAAEIQGLSEERFREEWNDWRDEDQKRWKQLTLSSDEVWRNHDREFDAFIRRTDALEQALPSLRSRIERLWQLERARATLYREQYQALLLEHDIDDERSNSNRPSPSRLGGG